MHAEQSISIADNLHEVIEKIQAATVKAGRSEGDVSLIAVSKFSSADKIKAAYRAGQRLFGESRIQECQEKIESLRDELSDAKWCLIGHLQSNKASKAVSLFDQVQSVDSLKIAEKLNAFALSSEKVLEVLLEVNSSGEEQKYGVGFDTAPKIAEQISSLESIKLTGLMTIGPQTDNEATIRNSFAKTKNLFDSLSSSFVASTLLESVGALPGAQLSMGMSADFELAIAEGATEVRIGTAIFGPREQN